LARNLVVVHLTTTFQPQLSKVYESRREDSVRRAWGKARRTTGWSQCRGRVVPHITKPVSGLHIDAVFVAAD